MRRPRMFWLSLALSLATFACNDDQPAHPFESDAAEDTDDAEGADAAGSESDRVVARSPNDVGRSGCIERLVPITGEVPTSRGFSAADVLRIVGQRRTAPLTWRDGRSTEITLSVLSAQAFLILSRDDPKYTANNVTFCDDRIVVQLHARLTTNDGKLDAELPELTLLARDARRLSGGSRGMPKSALRGSYAATAAKENECLYYTQVSVSLSESHFSGALLDSIANTPCDRRRDSSAVSSRTSVTW